MSSLPNINKDSAFNELLNSVTHCDLCERLCHMKKVLSKYNGNLESKVLFIAEAPGRLGAESTGIPLCGDKTGENFELLLSSIGWNRNDVFITNAILCNPQDENGNNSTPTKAEIENCSYYLEMTIKIISPAIIVTLGAKALDALKILCKHDYLISKNVGNCVEWNGMKLFPLYHMGPRALIHRSFANQRADFIKLSHIVDPLKGLKNRKLESNRQKNIQLNDKLLSLAKIIVDYCQELSLFKLTKLLYLIDLGFIKNAGRSVSGSIFLRMQEGPWIPSLQNMIKINDDFFDMYFIKKKPYIRSHQGSSVSQMFTDTEEAHIFSVLDKYSSYSDAAIKTAVYLTEPMKYVLRQEKKGIKMLKVPVLYKDDTVINIHGSINKDLSREEVSESIKDQLANESSLKNEDE
ncbi:uracil-DNA glycosylase family protein [Desulfitobacterium sp. THU1]|uniref:uracil-DNA glycosylase family protein n=1 Tax=Desulfitobacterium sp. THU1 TaxID=3138072 RepID=UPI00311F2476